MLSEENIKKLNMNGLYRCEPNPAYLLDKSDYCADDPYYMMNWEFYPKIVGGIYYMEDTSSLYFAKLVELTDENFDSFKFILDRKEVESVRFEEDWLEYRTEDRYKISSDFGGRTHPVFLVKKGACKDRKKVITRLEKDLAELEDLTKRKRQTLERVRNLEIEDERLKFV